MGRRPIAVAYKLCHLELHLSWGYAFFLAASQGDNLKTSPMICSIPACRFEETLPTVPVVQPSDFQ